MSLSDDSSDDGREHDMREESLRMERAKAFDKELLELEANLKAQCSKRTNSQSDEEEDSDDSLELQLGENHEREENLVKRVCKKPREVDLSEDAPVSSDESDDDDRKSPVVLSSKLQLLKEQLGKEQALEIAPHVEIISSDEEDEVAIIEKPSISSLLTQDDVISKYVTETRETESVPSVKLVFRHNKHQFTRMIPFKQPMGPHFQEICAKEFEGKPRKLVAFKLDGEALDDSTTPEDEGLDDGDLIDVIF